MWVSYWCLVFGVLLPILCVPWFFGVFGYAGWCCVVNAIWAFERVCFWVYLGFWDCFVFWCFGLWYWSYVFCCLILWFIVWLYYIFVGLIKYVGCLMLMWCLISVVSVGLLFSLNFMLFGLCLTEFWCFGVFFVCVLLIWLFCYMSLFSVTC